MNLDNSDEISAPRLQRVLLSGHSLAQSLVIKGTAVEGETSLNGLIVEATCRARSVAVW